MFRLTLFALFLALPVQAQSLEERIAAIERQTALLGIEDEKPKPPDPPKPPVVVVPVKPAKYVWRATTNPDQIGLEKDGVQVGAYSYVTGKYREYDAKADKWGEYVKPPVAAPERRTSPPARPFRGWPLPNAGERGVAEADLNATGPWPKGLEMPAGMRRYKRASMTQAIAVTNGYDSIVPTPRLMTESKYHMSGGLEDITDWRSDVYRNDTAERVRPYVADIAVLNSYGYFQPNRGWKRAYSDGARFMDVLSRRSTREVFEVRSLEKKDGRWRPSVLYRNVKARPEGYTGLSVTCASCHSEAGSGAYNGPLVPGGDFILSDVFPALE